MKKLFWNFGDKPLCITWDSGGSFQPAGFWKDECLVSWSHSSARIRPVNSASHMLNSGLWRMISPIYIILHGVKYENNSFTFTSTGLPLKVWEEKFDQKLSDWLKSILYQSFNMNDSIFVSFCWSKSSGGQEKWVGSSWTLILKHVAWVNIANISDRKQLRKFWLNRVIQVRYKFQLMKF